MNKALLQLGSELGHQAFSELAQRIIFVAFRSDKT